jgi:hypothetical protein
MPALVALERFSLHGVRLDRFRANSWMLMRRPCTKVRRPDGSLASRPLNASELMQETDVHAILTSHVRARRTPLDKCKLV